VIEESASTSSSSSTAKSPSTTKSSSTAKSSSNSRSLCSRSYSSINNVEDESSNATAKPTLPQTTSSSMISLPSSISSISFMSSSPSNISKAIANLQVLKGPTSSSDSPSSGDTTSESELIVDENACDDDSDELETSTKQSSVTSKGKKIFRH
jgi:hypothetical protein